MIPKKIVITGGAGYIGSNLCFRLIEQKHSITVIDNFTGNNTFPKFKEIEYINLNIANSENVDVLSKVLQSIDNPIIVHLAGFKSVGGSISSAKTYRDNNLEATKNLLKAMDISKIQDLIFSSTAAVYGNKNSFVNEKSPTFPISKYGEIKLSEENLIEDYVKKSSKHALIFRFFNVIGSLRSDLMEFSGENIMPKLLDCVRNDKRFNIYGDDYPTKDGTCVRDYLDMADLVDAFLIGLEKVHEEQCRIINLGSGRGTSIHEIINEVKLFAPIDIYSANKREGDISEIVADISLAQSLFGWKPKQNLKTTIRNTFAPILRNEIDQ